MKIVNIFLSVVQVTIVVLYILFYNVQYFWSLYGTFHNIISMVVK
jgi:hypothetical protein